MCDGRCEFDSSPLFKKDFLESEFFVSHRHVTKKAYWKHQIKDLSGVYKLKQLNVSFWDGLDIV